MVSACIQISAFESEGHVKHVHEREDGVGGQSEQARSSGCSAQKLLWL